MTVQVKVYVQAYDPAWYEEESITVHLYGDMNVKNVLHGIEEYRRAQGDGEGGVVFVTAFVEKGEE